MATLNQKTGTLATFTNTGNGTSYVSCDGAAALHVQYTSTGASGGTVELQQSLDGGTTFTTVANTSKTPTVSASANAAVSDPVGLYRATCTAHTNGTHTAKYRWARPLT